jgi:hypothetical protein
MLDAAGAKALGAGLLLRSLVTQCSKGLGMPWARNRMARGLRRSGTSPLWPNSWQPMGANFGRSGGLLAGCFAARRADFRIPWAVTRLRLLTSVAAVPEFGVHDRRFHAVRPAVRDRSHGRRAARLAGWHRAIFVPGLCESGSGRLAWAEARQLVQFAVMARPVAAAARGVSWALSGARGFLGASARHTCGAS